MSRRPTRTSYGYLAPAGARVVGWRCNNDGCGTGEHFAPRSWPHPCPQCGRPSDATFDEPWAHDARGLQIRHSLGSADRFERERAHLEQYVWAYKDACLRGDHRGAGAAWRAYHRASAPGWHSADIWWIGAATMAEMVSLACVFDEVDRAGGELLRSYPHIDTRDLEDDNARRTIVRDFVSMCITVLEHDLTLEHAWSRNVDAALRDIATRAEGVLTDHHHRRLRRLGEKRAFARSRAAIARTRQSAATAFEGLPALSPAGERGRAAAIDVDGPVGVAGVAGQGLPAVLTVADAALDIAETHADTGPLRDAIARLERVKGYCALTHLLRARHHAVDGDLRAAIKDLRRGANASGPIARRLRPHIVATWAILLARAEPGSLDRAVELCRDARRAGLRWWRRGTPADAALARLLLWRAMRDDATPQQRARDVGEADHLMRRRCRRSGFGPDDQMLLLEVLAARDTLEGRHTDLRQQWRDAIESPWSVPARARLAAAWAQWATDTNDTEVMAEASQRLVALTVADAIGRYGFAAKQRVMRAAQEYAEETGYWLARVERYREAVVALETGRAVGLSETFGRYDVTIPERLRGCGRAALADEYLAAVEDFESQRGQPSVQRRRAWARLHAVAEHVAAAIGTNPLVPDVQYEDIVAETGDGAVVYLGSATAGGYALVVAATHDPQYVDLPKLDRRSVVDLIDRALPDVDTSTGVARFVSIDGTLRRYRDLVAQGQVSDPLAEVLASLWDTGLKMLFYSAARGGIVTLVPVGPLSLLPLHAAGAPSPAWAGEVGWHHTGRFSAIRYAPNIRSLRWSRRTARELDGQPQTLLAVDVPDGHGVHADGHLHYVARETVEVTCRWTGHPAQPLHACTWDEFRAAADRHTVWHLACHGTVTSTSIMDSRLYFADRQVTLDDLRNLASLGRRRLAVLSACQTNVTGISMPNEVVGLPSVLLQIGFAGVVATAWAVDDLATTYLMASFYEQWCRQGVDPAVALHRAQAWLRTATRCDLAEMLPDITPGGEPGERPYADPRYWAAFAYTGA